MSEDEDEDFDSADTQTFDLDEDGVTDAVAIDTNADGTDDIVAIDTDADQQFDLVAVDSNADGWADVMGIDTDDDGVIDTAVIDATAADGAPDASWDDQLAPQVDDEPDDQTGAEDDGETTIADVQRAQRNLENTRIMGDYMHSRGVI